jgi:hypothetical protein
MHISYHIRLKDCHEYLRAKVNDYFNRKLYRCYLLLNFTPATGERILRAEQPAIVQ